MKIDIQIDITSIRPGEKMKPLADIIFRDKLYLADGSMLRWSRKLSDVKDIFIASIGETNIGALILLNAPKNEYPGVKINIGVYVKSSFRRQGIGTQLVEASRLKYPDFQIYPWKENNHTIKFYDSLGIENKDCYAG